MPLSRLAGARGPRPALLLATGLLGALAACSGGTHPSAAALSPSAAAATTAPAPTPHPVINRGSQLDTPGASSHGSLLITGGSGSGSPSAGPSRRTTGTSSPAPSPTPDRTPTPLPSGATVGVDEVTGDRFSPSSLTLHVGDSVLVTDQDPTVPHTFTISALHVDSGGMSHGQTFRYRFTTPGRFSFVCTYHQSLGMTGTLTVVR